MLQPVATRVSTSRACLLVTASCLFAIYTSSLIVEPPYVPPFLHSFATACQRTSESKHSQALTGTPPCGHTSSLPFALWLCVLSQQPFLRFYSLGLPPADSLHAAPQRADAALSNRPPHHFWLRQNREGRFDLPSWHSLGLSTAGGIPCTVAPKEVPMSKTTNHFASGFDSVFPQGDRSSIYLTKNITRKCVEQAEWLIKSKEDDISVLTQDGKAIAGADETNEENTLLICRKYGAVRGALHFDDVALDRIAERMDNLTNEITYLNSFIEQMKAAFEQMHWRCLHSFEQATEFSLFQESS